MKRKIIKETEFSEISIERLDNLKERLIKLATVKFDRYKVFVSVGYKSRRASVFVGFGDTIDAAYKSACDKAARYIKLIKAVPDCLKADLVVNEHILSIDEFTELAQKTKKYYFKYGISFDSSYNFAFLDQEVNSAALIKYSECNSYALQKNEKIDNLVGISWEDLPLRNECALNFDNINIHLRLTRNQTVNTKDFKIQQLIIFETVSCFSDNEAIEDIFDMDCRELSKTRRKIENIDVGIIKDIISKNAEYLVKTIHDNGKFVYGYFPCFNREINSYNSIRHALGVLGIADAYLNIKNDDFLPPLKKALEYLTTDLIWYVEDRAYIVDYVNNNEIRLGALAVAILAITKCMELFGKEDKYLRILTLLGNGILSMQDIETGKFHHVLKYPNLEKSDEFRIIYYSGEAAFALMRLYSVDKSEKWLHGVEKVFEFFIKNNYWKYTDHWLAYCTNEFTAVVDNDEYYKFGLKNAFHKLNYIENRITAYHTFLELLCATYKMIKNIKSKGKDYLLEEYDVDRLLRVIDIRVDNQLSSIFFPETAMYFKSPQTILGGVFIRHHTYRVRNDDVAHNLSGMCAYLNEILLEKNI